MKRSSGKPAIKRKLLIVLAIMAVLTVVAQLASMQMANQACFLGYHQARWQQFLPFNLLFFYLWGALLPLVVFLCGRLQRYAYQRKFLLSLHALAAVVLSLAHMVLLFFLTARVLGFELEPIGTATTFRGFFSKWIYSEAISYLALAALVHLVLIYRHNRRQDLRSSRLETELAQAQLQALKMQIHPHFLFNTLNTISSYVYKDQDLAVSMISRLSELLRLTLETGEETEISLGDELAITAKYLAIEQIRFAERLKVTQEIDPQARDQRVPALILQPLVENAIRHGISPQIEGGTISIHARIEKATLVIEVLDIGKGLRSPCRENGTGIGLKNIRSRLRQRYGERASLVLSPAGTGGCRAALTLPLDFPGPNEARP